MSGDGWTLTELRQRIDAIDAEVLELLSERAQLALYLGQIKIKAGRPIHDPAREAALLNKLEVLNKGPLDSESVRSIFKEVLAKTREIQLAQAEKSSKSES